MLIAAELYTHNITKAADLLLSHLTGSLLSGNRAKREQNLAEIEAMSLGTAGTGDLLDEELTGLSAWLAEEGFCVTIQS